MPKDDFTPTKGSTMMLDTILDGDENEGVLFQLTPASVRGISGLPEGIVGGDVSWEKEATQFNSFQIPNELTDDFDYDLVDLSWLDPSQVPDPSTLPKQVNEVDHQLQEAWGAERRTTGIHLIPAIEKDRAEYEQSLEEPVKKQAKSKAAVRDAVAKAWRQVTASVPLEEVAQGLVDTLGEDAFRAKEAFEQMKAERGLVGKVYIRADAYPKCATSAWSETVRKQARTASFVVQKPECASCVLAQQGRCAAFGGRRLVAEVPYEDAATLYAAQAEVAGVKLAGSPRQIKASLKKAFLTHKPVEVAPTNFPVQPDAARGVSAAQAGETLRSAAGPVKRVDLEAREASARLRSAQAKVANYVRQGLVSAADAEQVLRTVSDPSEIVARVASIAARPAKAGTYTASDMQIEGERSVRLLSAAGQEYGALPDPQEAAHARSFKAAVDRVAFYVREGRLDGVLAKTLIAKTQDPYELLQRVAHVLVAPAPVRTYTASHEYTEAEHAVRGLTAVTEAPAPIERSTSADARLLRQAQMRVARMVQAGLISKETAQQIAQRTSDPAQMTRWATAVALTPAKPKTYADGQVQDSSARAVRALRTVSAEDLAAAQAALDKAVATRQHAASLEGRHEAEVSRKASAVLSEAQRGVRGSALKDFIARTVPKADLSAVSRIVAPALRAMQAFDNTPSPAKQYEGVAYKVAQVEREQTGPNPQEVSKFALWVRRHMTEGMAGKDLDDLIRSRFASSVRAAGADLIKSLRAKHEGLSGHVYVDAQVYASSKGLEGCKEGSDRHRVTPIKNVLAFDKCASCVHRVALEDGTPRCALYAKRLINAADEVVEKPAVYQRKAIRMADAPDHAVIASLFAKSYDPSEFDLGGASDLDNIEIDENEDVEELGEILFGGLKIT